MNVRKNIPLLVGLVMMMCQSCSRDHLYYQTVSRDKVKLNIDWSKTAFAPDSRDYDDENRLNGVTIFAFDSVSIDRNAGKTIFSIDGRKVSGKLQRGAYIIDGQKKFVK